MSLTYALAKEFFTYSPETGDVHWLKTRNNRCTAGKRVSTASTDGALQVCFDHRTYRLHRVIWLYMTGSWPTKVIDHKDGDQTNNRWENLRDVSQSVNRENLRAAPANNKVGVLGVGRIGSRWRANIHVYGKSMALGSFNTLEDAQQAYLEAKRFWHEGCTI